MTYFFSLYLWTSLISSIFQFFKCFLNFQDTIFSLFLIYLFHSSSFFLLVFYFFLCLFIKSYCFHAFNLDFVFVSCMKLLSQSQLPLKVFYLN